METICPSPVKLYKFVLSILESVFSNVYLCDFAVVTRSSDCVSLTSVCGSKSLKKSVGIDYFSAFNIKCCSDIFVLILKFIFKLTLAKCLYIWKQAVVDPVSKQQTVLKAVSTVLTAFTKIFEFVTYEYGSQLYIPNSISVCIALSVSSMM
jgi:hypothetical protein